MTYQPLPNPLPVTESSPLTRLPTKTDGDQEYSLSRDETVHGQLNSIIKELRKMNFQLAIINDLKLDNEDI